MSCFAAVVVTGSLERPEGLKSEREGRDGETTDRKQDGKAASGRNLLYWTSDGGRM